MYHKTGQGILCVEYFGGDGMSDFKEAKKEFENNLSELQNDILILQSRIKKAKVELMQVQREEDIEKFLENNVLEEGLKHIELF